MLIRVLRTRVIVSNLDFPEGPCFDKDENLYFVDCERGSVIEVLKTGVVTDVVNTGRPVAVIVGPDNDLYVTECSLKSIVKVRKGGVVETVASEYQGKSFNGPNDLVFDNKGNLYFTDPYGSSLQNRTGCLYRVSVNGKVSLVDSDLAFPNGLVFSPDYQILYLAETHTRTVYRLWLSTDGCLLKKDILCVLTGGVGPDGLTVDRQGYIYAAHYGAGVVAVLSPDGKLVAELGVCGANPTNVTFPKHDTELYVTEAQTGSVIALTLERE